MIMYRFVFKNYNTGMELPFYVDTVEDASRFASMYSTHPYAVFTQLYAKKGTSQFRLKDYNSGKSVDVFVLDARDVKPFIDYMIDHGDEVRLEHHGEFTFGEIPRRYQGDFEDLYAYGFAKGRKTTAKKPRKKMTTRRKK